jgi:DNA-damage-inducible protein D
MIMNIEQIAKMQSRFNGLAEVVSDENIEFWFARDLQETLGYSKWERFKGIIE